MTIESTSAIETFKCKNDKNIATDRTLRKTSIKQHSDIRYQIPNWELFSRLEWGDNVALGLQDKIQNREFALMNNTIPWSNTITLSNQK